MFDIWGFLLQTLTASGAAVLLLVLKALFRDKLPPKWHFAIWGVLGILLLIPAGHNGRYTLFHWQLVVEVIKAWCNDFSSTQVLLPIPVLASVPKTLTQWIFAGYILGVVVHAVKYLVAYIRLRAVLRNGSAPCDSLADRIRQIAAAQKVKPCRVTQIPGLPSTFVCGIIRPVLAIPAEEAIDDKVILHELLHLKYKDTLWSVVVCLFRCLHWCNPLLIYCADQAINDMEARCDQHVLEQLEGEERRDYGRILLSMTNDRFAKTPGSTCINNGGKNIRGRIEAIARFKKYPAGMGLVSVCVIILLSLSLIAGAQASAVYDWASTSMWLPLASARSTPCTTQAGAFDTYAKAVLDQNGLYRVMCAPESMQEEIINEISEKEKIGIFPNWDCGLDEWPDAQSGYYIYNLKQCGENAYEGLLVIALSYPPDGQPEEDGKMYLAVQTLRVEKEKGRWVTIPLEAFRNVEAEKQSLDWGCMELPGICYTGTASNIRVDVVFQTVHQIDNIVQHENSGLFFSSYFDTTPKPNAVFDTANRCQNTSCTHLGPQEERNTVTQIGLAIAPVFEGEVRPDLPSAAQGNFSSSSSDGTALTSWEPESGWGPTRELTGSGGSIDPNTNAELPVYYAADLYLNGQLASQMELQEVAQ